MKISFYELLGMVEEGNIPEIVEYNGIQYKADYDDVDNSFLDYLIVDKKKINDTIHFYLGENILFSEMHIKNLLIPREKNKKIEKDKKIEHLKLYAPYPECTDDRFEDVENKINEIIDRLNGDK